MRLARKSSSHAATLRLRRRESLPGASRIRLWAMCLSVVKLAGALSVRIRHSSSRKDHVHEPVEAIFDRPVAADDRPERGRQQHQGGDVKARLALDLIPDFARALDHDDAAQSRPIVAFHKPSHIMDCGIGSGFDAAVIAVDRLMATDLGILKAVGLLLGSEDLDILA